jgi:AcrR family transcriptional regulator
MTGAALDDRAARDGGAPGLRERKKARTREALEAAAFELFATQGFEETTIDEIVAACDVSPRTFFRYFATKEEVLFANSDARLDRLLEVLVSRPRAEAPFDAVAASIMTVAREYEDERERMLVRWQILERTASLKWRSLERQRGWEDAIAEVLEQRSTPVAPDAALELRVVAGVTTAALRAAVALWLTDDRVDLTTLLRRAFGRLASGLATAPS